MQRGAERSGEKPSGALAGHFTGCCESLLQPVFHLRKGPDCGHTPFPDAPSGGAKRRIIPFPVFRAVIRAPFIAYLSNIFAIRGLKSLNYFPDNIIGKSGT
jgi:hypothetical protein